MTAPLAAGDCGAVYAWAGCRLLPLRYPGGVSGWDVNMEMALKSCMISGP